MKDWSRRMSEYFDCHLRGAEMAKWMKDGVPRLRMEEHLRERKPATKPDAPVVP